MTTKVSLRLSGIDFRDPTAYERVPVALEEVMFEATGQLSLATLFLEGPAPDLEVVAWARRIEEAFEGVTVVGVYDELVSLTDIAARCEVGAEAARLWASGRRRAQLRSFPAPAEVIGAVGGKLVNLYRWRAVVDWVREVIGRDPDEGVSYLDDHGIARLTWLLASGRSRARRPRSVGIRVTGQGSVGDSGQAAHVSGALDAVRLWAAAAAIPSEARDLSGAVDFAFRGMNRHAIVCNEVVQNVDDAVAAGDDLARQVLRR